MFAPVKPGLKDTWQNRFCKMTEFWQRTVLAVWNGFSSFCSAACVQWRCCSIAWWDGMLWAQPLSPQPPVCRWVMPWLVSTLNMLLWVSVCPVCLSVCWSLSVSLLACLSVCWPVCLVDWLLYSLSVGLPVCLLSAGLSVRLLVQLSLRERVHAVYCLLFICLLFYFLTWIQISYVYRK